MAGHFYYFLIGPCLFFQLLCVFILAPILRQCLGNESSLEDSFKDNLLDYSHYTRPEVIDGQTVPEVLLSGNQAKIDEWRSKESLKKTKEKRPDLGKK